MKTPTPTLPRPADLVPEVQVGPIRTTSPSDELNLRQPLRDAIEFVVGVLEALPRPDERERLLHDARGCPRVIDGWADEPPTGQEHEKAMQRVLRLHIAAANLGGTAQRSGRYLAK